VKLLEVKPRGQLMGAAFNPQPVNSLNFLQTYDLAPALLGSAASFTSPAIVIGSPAGYGRWRVFAYSDQAGTLSLQQSADGTAFYPTLTQAYAAGGQAVIVESLITLPYLQVNYVNGAAAQTVFRLLASLLAV
jgi:hypothetical protein